MPGEPPHMHLIYDQVFHRNQRSRLCAPVKVVLHNSGLIKAPLLVFRSPYALPCNCLCINVEQDPVFITQKTLRRVIRPIQPVSILKLRNMQPEDNHRIHVADTVVIRKFKHGIRLVFHSPEQEKLTGCRPAGMYGKIHPYRNRHCSVKLIHSGSDVETCDFIHRFHMD